MIERAAIAIMQGLGRLEHMPYVRGDVLVLAAWYCVLTWCLGGSASASPWALACWLALALRKPWPYVPRDPPWAPVAALGAMVAMLVAGAAVERLVAALG